MTSRIPLALPFIALLLAALLYLTACAEGKPSPTKNAGAATSTALPASTSALAEGTNSLSNNAGTPIGNADAPTVSTSLLAANETGYNIKFYFKDQHMASLGLAELHSLLEETIEMGGDTPGTGPTLQSALELAGISEYSRVTISGLVRGRIAAAELTLQQAQISDGVMLDFTNQGKTKLCGKDIQPSDWIIDVTEIRAE